MLLFGNGAHRKIQLREIFMNKIAQADERRDIKTPKLKSESVKRDFYS